MKVFCWFFALLCISNSQACLGNSGKFEISESGMKFVYEIIEIESSNGEIKRRGKISVFGADGEVIDIHSSAFLPGCNKGFAPIRIIQAMATNFPYSNKMKQRKFVAFCGSSDGKHNMLFIYQPFRGFVASLDFLEGPIVFEVDENKFYRSIVEYKIFISSVGALISYPVMYKLNSVGMSVGFSEKLDSYSLKKYKQAVDKNLKVFIEEKNKYSATTALLIANISGSKPLYCTTKKVLEDARGWSDAFSIIKEIESKFRMLTCDMEM